LRGNLTNKRRLKLKKFRKKKHGENNKGRIRSWRRRKRRLLNPSLFKGRSRRSSLTMVKL
jgi:hypothetical protein